MDKPITNDTRKMAHDLHLIVGRLVRRLRAAIPDDEIPLSQLLLLSRIEREGPTTATALADVEHVRIQSIAATIAHLERQGFVERSRDATDRRRWLISITPRGANLMGSVGHTRELWLSQAITNCLDDAERGTIVHAIELFDRLAEWPSSDT